MAGKISPLILQLMAKGGRETQAEIRAVGDAAKGMSGAVESRHSKMGGRPSRDVRNFQFGGATKRGDF